MEESECSRHTDTLGKLRRERSKGRQLTELTAPDSPSGRHAKGVGGCRCLILTTFPPSPTSKCKAVGLSVHHEDTTAPLCISSIDMTYQHLICFTVEVNKQVQDAIRQRMRERGLSQEALGEAVGMSQPNIARILSGRSGKVPQSVREILEVLDLELVAVPKGANVQELFESHKKGDRDG